MTCEIDTIKFIEAVKQRELLWNTSDPCYKDSQTKTEHWEVIAAQFGVSVHQCRRKWYSLRDVYRRELRKLTFNAKETDAEDDNLPKWQYFSRLEFLRDTVMPYIELCKKKAEAAAELSKPGIGQNDVTGYDEDFPLMPLVQTQFSNQDYVNSSQDTTITDELTKTLKFVQQFLSDSNGTYVAASNDEDDLFCKTMLCKIRKLSLPEKNKVKLQIMATVNSAEELLIETATKN